MITLKQLKSKLEKDFGWENLESDDNKWFVDNLLKDTIQAIDVSQQRELLDLLTEIANSDTLYSNTRHRLIARNLLKSNCG